MVRVDVRDDQSLLVVNPKQVEALVQAALDLEECPCDEVGVHLVAEAEMCQLHDEHFNDPSITDCMSFPVDDPRDDSLHFVALGDVFACPQVAIAYGKEHAICPYRELTLYIIHGLLHLLGLDDIEEVDRQEMRSAEARHMANLDAKHLCLLPPLPIHTDDL